MEELLMGGYLVLAGIVIGFYIRERAPLLSKIEDEMVDVFTGEKDNSTQVVEKAEFIMPSKAEEILSSKQNASIDDVLEG